MIRRNPNVWTVPKLLTNLKQPMGLTLNSEIAKCTKQLTSFIRFRSWSIVKVIHNNGNNGPFSGTYCIYSITRCLWA